MSSVPPGPGPGHGPAPRWTAAELARAVGGEVRGDGGAVVTALDGIERAGPGALTFVREAKYLALWPSSRAAAALVTRRVWQEAGGDAATTEPSPGRAIILVGDADRAMLDILRALEAAAPSAAPPAGRHPAASVDPAATVDDSASIGPAAVIGAGVRVGAGAVVHPGAVIGPGAAIGPHSVIHANAVVGSGCIIGARVILQPGVVIGGDGFGYLPAPDGNGLVKIPHLGRVEIGDDAEIGANTTIDRAKFGATVIGAGTKIDNLVQIGHGCRIGRACVICGCCALSGSVELGDGVMLAGGVGVADNVKIGAGAKVGARSGVMHDIPAGETWVGYPAEKSSRYLRIAAAIRSLPDVMPGLKKLLKSE